MQCDSDVLEYESQLRLDISRKQSLVEHKQEIYKGLPESLFAANEDFLIKLPFIYKFTSHIRHVRSDGNCFFRSYIFSLLEQLIGNKAGGLLLRKLATHLRSRIPSSLYETIQEFWEVLEEVLIGIETGKITSSDSLSDIFQDTSTDHYIITFLRCLCAKHLRQNEEEFFAFISNQADSVDEFCRREVEPLYKECDQVQVIALTREVGVPVRIVYLDRSPGTAPTIHILPFSSSSSLHDSNFLNIFDTNFEVVLLYRPGHYDILYKRI